MNRTSLRWRLPLSYAVIALITALAGMLLLIVIPLSELSSTRPAQPLKPVEDTASVPTTASSTRFDSGQSTAPRRSGIAAAEPIEGQSGNAPGNVKLSEDRAYAQEVFGSVARGLLIAATTAILLAVGMGWLISRQISVPVAALAQTSMRMTAGDLSARAEVDRRDEIGVLAHSFNEMAARMEITIHTLRDFVSDAAHELHTPLTVLHTDLELAAVDPDPAQRMAHLERALEQVRRFEILTANLLDLSRIEAGIQEERRPLDLTSLLSGLSEVYASRAEQAELTLEIDLPPATPLIVPGYEVSLRLAVGNLLDNAIKFTPPGGQVHLSLYQTDRFTVIAVKDTGIGIPSDNLPHLFRRFHRGRNAASYPGSGLGLAITESIVQAHAGTIDVQSDEGGTCFRILLGRTLESPDGPRGAEHHQYR